MMHFHQQPVRAHRNRRSRQRQHLVPLPVPCDGSTKIGKWLRFFTAGTIAKSSVFRE